MAQKIILGFLAVLILGTYSEESVKRTIELCQNKSPTRHLIPRSPNNYQMKDLLHSTTMKEEIKHRRCLSYKVNLVLRKSQPSSETSI